MTAINHERLLERFIRYVQVDTTAGDVSKAVPSSPGQLVLGKILVEELKAIGLKDAEQDQYGIIMATVPATVDRATPVVALCAHLDTSPETSGTGVKPQVVRNYQGNDLVLPANTAKVIRVDANPELKDLIGKTIITTDGTTLLGSDDKSGVAVIVETAATLMEHPEIPHGAIRICLTCDEEVGHGVDHVDLAKLGAAVCYTLDGGGTDEIDVETFSADQATITVQGVNIHPSIGKGRMINAVRVMSDFLKRLPRGLSPEMTDDREGFLHPYHLEATVAQATVKVLLRDFDTVNLKNQATILHEAAADAQAAYPGSKIDVTIETQYRNMADGLKKEPRAVQYAEEALHRLGRTPRKTIVRGGTDGSRFTELGLPTPNLSTGEHNPHSPLEWTCLEEMTAAVEMLVELAKVWGEKG